VCELARGLGVPVDALDLRPVRERLAEERARVLRRRGHRRVERLPGLELLFLRRVHRDADLTFGDDDAALRTFEAEARARDLRLGAEDVGLRRVADRELALRVLEVRLR